MLKRVCFLQWHRVASARGGRGVMLGVQEHLRSQEHQRCTALDNALNRAEADRDQRVRPLSTPSESQTSSKRLLPEPAPENHDYDVGIETEEARDQEQRRLVPAVSAAQQQLQEAQQEVEEAQQLLEVAPPQIQREKQEAEKQEARSRFAQHADSSLIASSLSQTPSLDGAQQQHLNLRLN